MNYHMCGRVLFARRRPCNFALFFIAVFLLWAFGIISIARREPPPLPVKIPDLEPEHPVHTEDVYNKTLGFEKVFVLGLPARTDRRDAIVLSSVLSDFEIEFINGVGGAAVPDKVLPLGSNGRQRPTNLEVGSWRGHINAIREIVHRNLTSALIMEDDADWDVRLREQIFNFAKSTQVLLQPMHATNVYFDTSLNSGSTNSPYRKEAPLNRLPWTRAPSQTPYGDNWDVLWLGHCGMQLPTREMKIPRALIGHYPDYTVPQKQYLKFLSQPSDLEEEFLDHTRVVHRVQDGSCSTAYALSRRGARSLLNDAGLKHFDAPLDIMLRMFCEGTGGRRRHVCLTSSPALFEQHRPAGTKSKQSDIADHRDEIEEHAHTDNIRVSMRMNAEAFMAMQPLMEQYPDERKPLDEKEYENYKHKHMEIYPDLHPETNQYDK
ncbi:hypothetical protein PFICI_10223 [Pestalotiopsis fici W106-1]|uniref:Glycosyltransferase family 25 protein n=1 Tax=Pestalotiopsis fici (strain W106-1 / CGMCC3.15140) TaxID=1229662 RepID=W3WZ46_PESFW|nr:uncharacterized protein PFICI_10223 [Pestalotiopsis fici W106-1]ETS78161.1 hypothetical protein PFICI_10223 [Pestalotiopsis fici W106-1]